jgi:glycosyltransferase involved in cell wall biosynthesis
MNARRPLRVALVIPTLDRGGAEKQLCLLASGLPEHGIEPHVVLLTRDGPLREQLSAANIPVTLIGKHFRADPTAYFRLRRWLREWKPDVVHSWLFAANAYARRAALSAKVPVILGSERCVDLWKTPAHFWIDRYLAARTDGITTNSTGVRDFYASHGIEPDRIFVIANGIQPRKETAISREEAFGRLGVDPKRHLILSVGRLWPQKRYRDLIWAAELLGTLRDDVTYVIIGDGPQSGELLRFRDSLSKPDRVRFVGHRDDVAELLPHADLFWNGSEYEGQSNSILEAMQAGVCTVAANIPGNRDLVTDQQTGRLVEPGDKADFARVSQYLLTHPEERIRLAVAGGEAIRTHFTVPRMVTEHAELYQRIFAMKLLAIGKK